VDNSAEATSANTIERLRWEEREIVEYVEEEPLRALAVAGGLGFIFGGGANSRIGLALLTLVGRIALRGAATNFIVGLVTGNHDNQGADRAYDSQRKYRNGNYDND
jgi:hypothetical protein